MRAIEYVNDLKKRVGAPYVYGAKQNKDFNKRTTLADIETLQDKYGKGYVWDSDLIKANNYCCDCSGFVDYQFQMGYSSSLLQVADKIECIRKSNGKLDMSKVKKIPLGAVLWQQGHVGVFIGFKGATPYYIAEDGSKYNCRINKLSDSGFTRACWKHAGYNITFYNPKTFKTIRKTTAYTTNEAIKKKRTYQKGVTINAVAKVNNYVLCRNYGYNQNCWVSIRDLVEVKNENFK